MFNRRISKVLLVMAVLLALSTMAFAFAAANTLPASTYAGDGNVSISGIVVENVDYTIARTIDPGTTYITNVELTLNPAVPTGPTIQVKLVQTGNTWYACTTLDLGVTYNCPITNNITVTAADNLRVIAIDE